MKSTPELYKRPNLIQPLFVASATEPPTDRAQFLIAVLPYELWQLIASFLPLSSKASLCFASRQFAHVLGTQCWRMLHENNEERRTFLKFLDYQLPMHILCFDCNIFHKKAAFKRCNEPRNYNGGLITLRLGHGVASLRFSEVQLAMRAERFGSEYGEPFPSLEVIVTRRNITPATGYTYNFETAAVEGRLLFRLETTKRTSFADVAEVPDLRWSLGVCDHYCNEIAQLWRSASFSASTCSNNDGVLHDERHRHRCMVLHRCGTCTSEYTLRIKSANPSGFVLQLTRWSDVGDGIDPRSDVWQAAMCDSKNPAVGALVWKGLSSVRHRFESSNGRRYE